MKRDIGFFLPTRQGSLRVKNKNTRPFSNFQGGLLELKLKQLMACHTLARIVLSTNDDRSKEVAKLADPSGERIHVVARPEHLCLDTTPLVELIKYVPTILSTEHIMWGHATTPFTGAADYDQAVNLYFEQLSKGKDSLISVMPLRNFLLRPADAKLVNVDQQQGKWPRTQDLPLLYEVNHAMFVTSRQNYLKLEDRIGSAPYLHEQDRIRSFDIDWEEDFQIAEAIHDKIFRNQEHPMGL